MFFIAVGFGWIVLQDQESRKPGGYGKSLYLLSIDCGRLWPQSCPLVLVRNLALPVICQDTRLILYLNNTIIVYCGVASFHGDSSINDDLCSTVWYSLRFKFNTRCINWYEYLERYYFYRSYAKRRLSRRY